MIIPTGFGQCNLIFGGSGYLRGAQVAIGFDNNSALDPADIAALFVANFTANVAGVMGTAISLLQVKVKLGPNDTGPEATVSAGVPGTNAGNTLPPNIGVLMSKHTAIGGLKNKGKSFWPGATETQTDGGGLLTSAALTAWLAAVQAFTADMATDDVPMVILHGDATTPTAVTGVTVAQLLAQQHRRIRRNSGRRSTP